MWFKTFSLRKLTGVLSIVLAISIIIGLITGNYVSASVSQRKLPIYSVETDEKKIAITFDAAWTNQDTQQLIEILKKHNARATFFIVGDWAEKFPDSVKAFYDAGHTIANHSDTHKAFSKCSRDEIKAEMLNRNIEEMTVGQYIIRWTSILSNRFDTTGFKRAYGDLYKAYTKQTASRRFTISV